MSDKRSGRTGIFYGWWIVGGCFIMLMLMAGAGFYSFSIFIKPLEENFGWSRSSISMTMSIYFLLGGFAGPLVGRLVETLGPKRVMLVSGVIFGLCFVLLSFTHALWYFYLIYAVLSFSHSGLSVIPVSSLLARWFVRRRGSALGISMVGIAVGGLIMAPTVGYVTEQWGWRAAFVFLGVVVWIFSVPVTTLIIKARPEDVGLLPDGEPGQNTALDGGGRPFRQEVGNGWTLREAVRTRAFWWIAASYFLAPLAQMGVMQHQVPLITDAGIPASTAAAALGITAGMGGLGKVAFGRISESMPVRFAAMLCFGLQALGVLILINAKSIGAVWIYVVVFGFAMGGVVVLLPLLVGEFFGLASFGTILGSLSMTQALGASTGAYLSGWIYDRLGSYHYALLSYVFIYAAATAMVFLSGKHGPYNEAPAPPKSPNLGDGGPNGRGGDHL
jgi:sugar phosphate permease